MSEGSLARVEEAPYPGAITFRVNTKLPSLENYRGRGRGSPRRGESEREYVKITAARELIGWKCRQGARPGQLAKIYGERVAIEIGLYRQDIDCDNTKLIVDSLKHIVYPDDSKEYVRSVYAEHGDDDIFDEPTVIVRVVVFE